MTIGEKSCRYVYMHKNSNYTTHSMTQRWLNSPSKRFLSIMFLTFFERIDPAQSMAKPDVVEKIEWDGIECVRFWDILKSWQTSIDWTLRAERERLNHIAGEWIMMTDYVRRETNPNKIDSILFHMCQKLSVSPPPMVPFHSIRNHTIQVNSTCKYDTKLVASFILLRSQAHSPHCIRKIIAPQMRE